MEKCILNRSSNESAWKCFPLFSFSLSLYSCMIGTNGKWAFEWFATFFVLIFDSLINLARTRFLILSMNSIASFSISFIYDTHTKWKPSIPVAGSHFQLIDWMSKRVWMCKFRSADSIGAKCVLEFVRCGIRNGCFVGIRDSISKNQNTNRNIRSPFVDIEMKNSLITLSVTVGLVDFMEDL